MIEEPQYWYRIDEKWELHTAREWSVRIMPTFSIFSPDRFTPANNINNAKVKKYLPSLIIGPMIEEGRNAGNYPVEAYPDCASERYVVRMICSPEFIAQPDAKDFIMKQATFIYNQEMTRIDRLFGEEE